MPGKRFFRAGFAIFCLLTASYSHAAGETPEPGKMTAADIHAMMESGNPDYIIYDMRDNFDYVLEHIPGSVNLPLRMIERRITEISEEKLLILIFRDAGEAGRAWKFLTDNGYDPDRIKIFDEGMEQWTNAGYPVEDSITH